jgi:hypothetical protein
MNSFMIGAWLSRSKVRIDVSDTTCRILHAALAQEFSMFFVEVKTRRNQTGRNPTKVVSATYQRHGIPKLPRFLRWLALVSVRGCLPRPAYTPHVYGAQGPSMTMVSTSRALCDAKKDHIHTFVLLCDETRARRTYPAWYKREHVSKTIAHDTSALVALGTTLVQELLIFLGLPVHRRCEATPSTQFSI